MRGLFSTLILMMIYFVIYKNKKDKDFKMFTNVIFDKESEAEEFGRKSMKRGFEYKVVEYNKENYERYFTCGIVMDSKAAMTTEQYELCSTIARGMIKMATSDPQTTFMYGLRGFADDKKSNKQDLAINSVAEFDSEDNVIEYLKNKRDKELN